jgi:hypothetical protein
MWSEVCGICCSLRDLDTSVYSYKVIPRILCVQFKYYTILFKKIISNHNESPITFCYKSMDKNNWVIYEMIRKKLTLKTLT